MISYITNQIFLLFLGFIMFFSLMKVLEEKKNIIAGVIERRGTKCAIYFRKQQRGETQRGCFIQFVDKIKKKKNRDLFIKIVA